MGVAKRNGKVGAAVCGLLIGSLALMLGIWERGVHRLNVVARDAVTKQSPAGGVSKVNQVKVLIEWQFDKPGDMKGWQPNRDLTDVKVADGALCARAIGADPILVSKPFEIPAHPWQVIEVRLKADRDGTAEFFWTNTTQTRFGGFSPGKETPFAVTGDNQWHTYRIYPFWHAEGKIILLRFDMYKECTFSVQWIRIVEQTEPTKLKEPVPAEFNFAEGRQGRQGWSGIGGAHVSADKGRLIVRTTSLQSWAVSPPISVVSDEQPYLAIRMAINKGDHATFLFVSSEVNGLQSIIFPIKPDGRMHTYNLDAAIYQNWRGKIIAVGLRPSNEPKARAEVEWLKVSDRPQGYPEVEVSRFMLAGAVHRAGIPAKLVAMLRNLGGETAKDVTVSLSLPKGISLVSGNSNQEVAPLDWEAEEMVTWEVIAQNPTRAVANLKVSAANSKPVVASTTLVFTQRLNVSKADYVPPPQPAKTDYQVGVYYFPGWQTAGQWAPIFPFPERTPVLGWYREGDPQVADWHIKWAVEHGISFFIYDWYWVKGARFLEHALHDGYFKSRYHKLLKFCLLWANHNPKGTSSEEDCLSVTKFWLDNYFQRDEYLKIDGKPVVVIFSAQRLTEDMSSIGVHQAFEKMRALCRERGLNGLYLVACGNDDANLLRRLKEEGYDAVSAYNWAGAGLKGGERRAPFDTLITGYRQMWENILRSDTLPLIPPISGGWDSRPWHGEGALVRYGMTPEKFKRHLQDAKQLIDKRQGVVGKLAFIEAWNEWGEGSYIEPHQEFGFGYLDAIREVFTDAPKEHLDVTPVDVGLGPYDVPMLPLKTAWDFERAGDQEGWGALMQMSNVRAEGGCLKGETNGNDPALVSPPLKVRAANFPYVTIRMRISKNDTAQLFWATSKVSEREASSVRFSVVGDDEFHEYKLHVRANRFWRGIITRLRFDPATHPKVMVEVDYIRLAKEG